MGRPEQRDGRGERAEDVEYQTKVQPLRHVKTTPFEYSGRATQTVQMLASENGFVQLWIPVGVRRLKIYSLFPGWRDESVADLGLLSVTPLA